MDSSIVKLLFTPYQECHMTCMGVFLFFFVKEDIISLATAAIILRYTAIDSTRKLIYL